MTTTWASPMMMSILFLISTSHAFRPRMLARRVAPHPTKVATTRHMSASTEQDVKYSPVFDFGIESTVDSFDRIDDAIMGGISTSALQNVPGQPFATWTGICREDGGGFCGTRTLPFSEPLKIENAEGLYVDCRLVSDDEADRRVWKLSTRTEASRGEELFQAQFEIPKTVDDEWARIKVPFDKFSRVRGARFVEGANPMNVTGGIYQIGLTMSKFVIAERMTSLENFRPGFFELHLKEIGLYSRDKLLVGAPNTLSTDEMKQKRPVVLKMIFAFSKMFFSEKANRRKAAMKKLREKRNLSRAQAILYGIRGRSESVGLLRSLAQAGGIVGVDTFRTVLGFFLRYGVFLPIRFLNKSITMLRRQDQGKQQSNKSSLASP